LIDLAAEAKMTEILRFLIEHLQFLYASGRYRFVDSETSTSFGGDTFLILASDVMRIRLVRDRGQLFMDFQATAERDDRDWFSIDVVRRLVTGERQDTAELSPEYARFLEEHLDEIEKRFSEEELANTRKALKELERIRGKELFD
jgi:hypothetical protein